MVVSDDHGAVRVAENYLGTHIDETVRKEKTALEHLLMDEHTALALGGDHQHHRQQVGSQSRPRGIRESHDRTVQEGLDLVMLLSRNEDVIPALLEIYTQAPEAVRNDAQVLIRDVLYGNGTLGQRGHAYERTHLDHVRKNGVHSPVQTLHTLDSQHIGSYPVNLRTHRHQQFAELLHIGLAGGVVDRRLALRKGRCHKDVGRSGHGGLVEEHISAP